MNIFVLAADPVEAAKMHCDRHVVKMILEAGQMLCAAHWLGWSRQLQPTCGTKRGELDGWLRVNIPQELQPPWRLTHTYHPCTQWTQRSAENYDWHSRLGVALCEEYTRRYGRVHKCEPVHRWLANNRPPAYELDLPTMTPHAVCMPEMFKVPDNPVESYRNYYRQDKVRFAKWKNSPEPLWFRPTEVE